jgi:prepilin-type N-terminal cleavage/methylation domain-containing protein
MRNHSSNNLNIYGFTLIELMLAISLLVALSGLVYVNINPKSRFEEARNQQRITDVYELMQAIALHRSENKGNFMNEISSLNTSLYYQIGTGNDCSEACVNPSVTLENNCVDLSSLKTNGYIPNLPIDPYNKSATEEKTKYFLHLNTNNTLSVGACLPELGTNESVPEISITK